MEVVLKEEEKSIDRQLDNSNGNFDANLTFIHPFIIGMP